MYLFIIICLMHTLFTPILHLLILRINKGQVRLIYLIFSLCLAIIINLLNINYFNFILLDIEKYLILIILHIFIFLSYAELFSMLCRGFSLRILTDVYLNKKILKSNINNEYARGKGHKWLFEKRLNSIINLGFVIFENNHYHLSIKGKIVSNNSIFIKKLLSLGKGGE